MEKKCSKHPRTEAVCQLGQPLAALMDIAGRATSCHVPSSEQPSPRNIAFCGDPHVQVHPRDGVLIPGYNAPALPIKPVRDPSLTLIALSGIEPEGPVLVEVPLVQNNSTFTALSMLAGRRVGFADRYERNGDQEPLKHRAPFLRALEQLRQAGALLVPVSAQQVDGSLQFDLHTRNEIDDLMTEHRLDALVSDSQSAAFHQACWSGYPRLGEPLGAGATLWFYGARWSKDSLAVLVQGYRSVRGHSDAR